MQWFYYKIPSAHNPPSPLFVHLGIPKTGSSSTRWLIRQHCRMAGERCLTLERPDTAIGDDIKYILLQDPHAVHKTTERECIYLTTLRNPISAAISWYYWRLQIGKELSMDEYIGAMPQSFNYMSRWLVHFDERDYDGAFDIKAFFMDDDGGFYPEIPDDELLEKAKKILTTKIHMFGLLEKPIESYFMMFDLFGWAQAPLYQRTNFSVKTDQKGFDDLEPGLQEKLLSCFSVDRELYAFAQSHFEEREKEILEKYGSHISQYRDVCQNLEIQLLNQKGLTIEDGHIVHMTEQAGGPNPTQLGGFFGLQPQGRLLQIEDYYPVVFGKAMDPE